MEEKENHVEENHAEENPREKSREENHAEEKINMHNFISLIFITFCHNINLITFLYCS